MPGWLLIIILFSSWILLLLIIIFSLVGIRLCDYNNNRLGILILFLTLNIVGLILGICIINNNKKTIKKIKELNFDVNDFLKYYRIKPSIENTK